MSHITRPDGSKVHCYAPGDGHLSYAAGCEGKARSYDITDDGARQLCPNGWEVYKDGPYHRARPIKPE